MHATIDADEQVAERKMVPELEKFWKTVKDNPSDFTGWTYLLQYVEQEVCDSFENAFFFPIVVPIALVLSHSVGMQL